MADKAVHIASEISSCGLLDQEAHLKPETQNIKKTLNLNPEPCTETGGQLGESQHVVHPDLQ